MARPVARRATNTFSCFPPACFVLFGYSCCGFECGFGVFCMFCFDCRTLYGIVLWAVGPCWVRRVYAGSHLPRHVPRQQPTGLWCPLVSAQWRSGCSPVRPPHVPSSSAGEHSVQWPTATNVTCPRGLRTPGLGPPSSAWCGPGGWLLGGIRSVATHAPTPPLPCPLSIEGVWGPKSDRPWDSCRPRSGSRGGKGRHARSRWQATGEPPAAPRGTGGGVATRGSRRGPGRRGRGGGGGA